MQVATVCMCSDVWKICTFYVLEICSVVCIFRVRDQGITWGTSEWCVHIHMKGDRAHWNWLVLGWDS